MLPPTYFTCMELYESTTPAEALAAAEQRDLVPVEPSADVDGDNAYLTLPLHLARLGRDVSRTMRP